jgi:hypothetical protein
MSRGPGRIERVIADAFTNNPSATFTVADLAASAYPGVNRIEKKHRVAILRAAWSVYRKLGWTAMREDRLGGELVFCNSLDVRSYALAFIRCHSRYHPHGGRTPLHELEERVDNPNAPNTEWPNMQPGAVWARSVEINKARFIGDHETAKALFEVHAVKTKVEVYRGRY